MKPLISITMVVAGFAGGWFIRDATLAEWSLQPTPANVMRINVRNGETHILDTINNRWRELGEGVNADGSAPSVSK